MNLRDHWVNLFPDLPPSSVAHLKSRHCERSAAIQLINNAFVNRSIWIAALRSQ